MHNSEEEFLRAYEKIAQLTGEDLTRIIETTASFCLVTDRESPLYGRIGVYHSSSGYEDFYKFKEFKKPRALNREQIFSAINPVMVLEEREKLGTLFQI